MLKSILESDDLSNKLESVHDKIRLFITQKGSELEEEAVDLQRKGGYSREFVENLLDSIDEALDDIDTYKIKKKYVYDSDEESNIREFISEMNKKYG